MTDRRGESDRAERNLPGILESGVESKLTSTDDPELRVFPEMFGCRFITGDNAFTDGQPPYLVPADDSDEVRGAARAGGCCVTVEQVQVAHREFSVCRPEQRRPSAIREFGRKVEWLRGEIVAILQRDRKDLRWDLCNMATTCAGGEGSVVCPQRAPLLDPMDVGRVNVEGLLAGEDRTGVTGEAHFEGDGDGVLGAGQEVRGRDCSRFEAGGVELSEPGGLEHLAGVDRGRRHTGSKVLRRVAVHAPPTHLDPVLVRRADRDPLLGREP